MPFRASGPILLPMKRTIAAAAAAVLSALGALRAAAAPAGSADARPVAFAVTIADLHRAALDGDDRGIPGDKDLVVDAKIGSITIVEETDESFSAEVELIGGSWLGEENVELYRAYALFDGPAFRDLFSRRSSTRLLPGDKVLVLGTYVGIGTDYDDSTPVAVVEAKELRRL